jgi:regulator of nucleoside diphosphate kinase
MQKLNDNKLVLTTEDYTLLTSYINGMWGETAFDRKNTEALKAELKKAKIVDKDKFPTDVVRLNSKVTIKAEDKNELIELMLVTPDKANIKEKKSSILAPIGTALIGFRQGQKIEWQVPAGSKTFTILEVINHLE